MARELFASWSDYQAGIDRLLALAERQIWIFDHDLQTLKLDAEDRLEPIRRLLASHRGDSLRILLGDAGPLTRGQPRLMSLLASHHHAMTVFQTADHLAHLRDSMILVDGRHGLIRFDREQPRSKLLIDEQEELIPYHRRFEEILAEGGTPVTATTLGL